VGQKYLIDSNAIIDFFNKSLPESGRNLLAKSIPVISIVTFIEIFSNKSITFREQTQLQEFTDTAIIYEIDRNIAFKTIELRLNYKIKLPDALIAATAIHYGLTLITRNVSDFSNIVGLKVINPHTV
jgi:predicted nucleic acid-binding protein